MPGATAGDLACNALVCPALPWDVPECLGKRLAQQGSLPWDAPECLESAEAPLSAFRRATRYGSGVAIDATIHSQRNRVRPSLSIPSAPCQITRPSTPPALSSFGRVSSYSTSHASATSPDKNTVRKPQPGNNVSQHVRAFWAILRKPNLTPPFLHHL